LGWKATLVREKPLFHGEVPWNAGEARSGDGPSELKRDGGEATVSRSGRG